MLDKIKTILEPYNPVPFYDHEQQLVGYSVFQDVRTIDDRKLTTLGAIKLISMAPGVVRTYGDPGLIDMKPIRGMSSNSIIEKAKKKKFKEIEKELKWSKRNGEQSTEKDIAPTETPKNTEGGEPK